MNKTQGFELNYHFQSGITVWLNLPVRLFYFLHRIVQPAPVQQLTAAYNSKVDLKTGAQLFMNLVDQQRRAMYRCPSFGSNES